MVPFARTLDDIHVGGHHVGLAGWRRSARLTGHKPHNDHGELVTDGRPHFNALSNLPLQTVERGPTVCRTTVALQTNPSSSIHLVNNPIRTGEAEDGLPQQSPPNVPLYPLSPAAACGSNWQLAVYCMIMRDHLQILYYIFYCTTNTQNTRHVGLGGTGLSSSTVPSPNNIDQNT